MRILVWNCKMALSRKRQPLYTLGADIAVIPECAKKCVDLCIEDGFDGCWFGENPNKGLGVLIRKPWRIARIGKVCNRWVVPVSIVGGSFDFLLIAVWTTLIRGNLERSYIGQISEAVLQNPRWFAKNKVIIAGDFNSNTRWDGKRELHSHSRLVRQLEKHGLISSYHQFFSEAQACETRQTYYQWHHREPAFHIDYIFIPECWATQMKSVEVGEYDVWSKLSDHVPLTVDMHENSGGLNRSMQHSSRTRLTLKTKVKSLVRVRSAGTLPWLGFDRRQPNRSLLPGKHCRINVLDGVASTG